MPLRSQLGWQEEGVELIGMLPPSFSLAQPPHPQSLPTLNSITAFTAVGIILQEIEIFIPPEEIFPYRFLFRKKSGGNASCNISC